MPLIVAIGASAGGLKAYGEFFSAMPADSGMAFVLIQHLAPDHDSMMVDILSRKTSMKVIEAQNGMTVTANQIYMIPSNATMTISNGHLIIESPAPPLEHRHPIDSFLFSLAEDQKDNAVGIILSGSGSDGSMGIIAIKEHGGLTIAQSEYGQPPDQMDQVAMSGMPNSATATGQVDYILSATAMPARLLEYQKHLTKVQTHKNADGAREDVIAYLPEIFSQLYTSLGHDFSHYKNNTMVRRIQRRMQLMQIDAVPNFIEVLKKDPKQLELLFYDLLIGVTEFFRDAEAFKVMEKEIIPKLLENKSINDQVRIWISACATGEEAYSIAILLAEAIQELHSAPKVLLFATDIDDRAIAIARNGRYLKTHLDNVSPERLKRWFVKEGEYYTVSSQIREMCIFSIHNLLKDPPFSKIDLISCRNLLIYLDGVLQDRLIPIFHYALRPSGYLFLGSSEGILRKSKYFDVVDEKQRLFVRRDDTSPRLPQYPLFEATGIREISQIKGYPMQLAKDTGLERGARRVMERYSPAHVIIDRHYHVVSFSGQTGRYIDPSPGIATLDFFHLVQKAIRPAARQLIQQAIATQQRVGKEKIPFEVNGVSDTVTMIVEPILPADGRAEHYIVVFQHLEASDVIDAETVDGTEVEGANPELEKLKAELQATKARLQAALDESEEINNDLKSTNEEFQSINEELQSSNEELESSKEEMQSINEELQTVNTELTNKNLILQRVNSDIQNLLESTQIATLFLDEKLCVRNFTPAITDLFHLRQTDFGRPIREISTRLNYETLEQEIKKTMQNTVMVEREVYLPDTDQAFIMNIRPYRTITNVLDGVVITFVDVSERKRHEWELSRLAAIVAYSRDAIIGHTLEGTITSWNAGAEKIFGFASEEVVGKLLSTLFTNGRPDKELVDSLDQLKRGELIPPFQLPSRKKTGESIEVSITISPVRNPEGVIISASTFARDMTEWVRSERQKVLLLAELDHRVKNTLATVQSIARQTALHTDSPETFFKTFEERLVSLSRSHNLLVKSHWEGASLQQLVNSELLPFGESRYAIEGEEVYLNARQIIILGMIFHELATNAAKYGALSVGSGRVLVTWSINSTDSLRLLKIHWKEEGGPKVEPPKRKGFGTQLIERALATEEKGDINLDFDPSGLNCTMQFALVTDEAEVYSA